MTDPTATTRSSTTTTYRLNLSTATLSEIRELVKMTEHLGPDTAVRAGIFGLDLTVHETRLTETDQETTR